jgi:hypothetical protein
MKSFNLKTKISIVIIVVVLNCFSCLTDKPSDEFKSYIVTDLMHEINTKNSKYIVFSLYSCQDCLIKIRELLTKLDNDENHIYLVVAANSKKEIRQFFTVLQKHKSIEIIFDTKMALVSKDFYNDGKNNFYQYFDEELISSFSFDSKNNFIKLEEILNQKNY